MPFYVGVLYFRKFLALSIMLLAALSFGIQASAADTQKKYDFHIEAATLGEALDELVQITKVQLLFPHKLAKETGIKPVIGSFFVQEALDILLEGTGFSSGLTKGGMVVVSSKKAQVGKTVKQTKEKRLLAGISSFLFGNEPVSIKNSNQDNDDPSEGLIEELLVTATRRKSTVLDVPYNIQALSAQSLENAGAQNMKDFVRLIPGLSFTDTGARDGLRVFLRGLRSGDDIGLIPTTSTYLDDTLVDRPSNFRPLDLKIVDIERIEVLRGPQGTLYGGGSVGGTLRYISKKPAMNEWSGRVGTLGSYTDSGSLNYNISGMVNTPIVDDKVAMRVSAGYFSNSGVVDNSNLDEDNIDWEATFSGRISLRIAPTEKLAVDVAYHREDTTYGDASQYDNALGEYNVDYDYLGRKKDITNLTNLTVSYDFGFAELVSSISYIDEKIEHSADITRTIRDRYIASLVADTSIPVPDITSYNEVFADNASLSEEIRLVSNTNGRFDWIVGAFIYDAKSAGGYDEYVEQPFDYQNDIEALLGVKINDDRQWRGRYQTTYNQWAVFGEFGLNITDTWHASVGIRHYDFKRTGLNSQIDQWAARDEYGFARLTPIESEISTGELNENGEALRFNTSYELNDSSLLYFTVAEGYRPGGFNVANSATELPDEYKQYESDTLISYELGGKFSLFENHIYLSSSVYYIDWSNMQTQIQLPTLFGKRGNAGKAHSKGLELELNARNLFAKGLDAAIGYAYTDAKLDETIDGIGYEAESVPFVPKHSVSFLLDYQKTLRSGWVMGVNFLTTYTGPTYTGFGPITPGYDGASDNDEYFFLGDYFLANMSVRLERGSWVVRMSADNLLGSEGNTYREISRSQSLYRDPSVFINIVRPRTIGIELTRHF